MRFKKNLIGKTKPTFLEKLILLHLAYGEAEPQLQQFKQLVSLSPKIVKSVKDKIEEKSDFKNEISVSKTYQVQVHLISCRYTQCIFPEHLVSTNV